MQSSPLPSINGKSFGGAGSAQKPELNIITGPTAHKPNVRPATPGSAVSDRKIRETRLSSLNPTIRPASPARRIPDQHKTLKRSSSSPGILETIKRFLFGNNSGEIIRKSNGAPAALASLPPRQNPSQRSSKPLPKPATQGYKINEKSPMRSKSLPNSKRRLSSKAGAPLSLASPTLPPTLKDSEVFKLPLPVMMPPTRSSSTPIRKSQNSPKQLKSMPPVSPLRSPTRSSSLESPHFPMPRTAKYSTQLTDASESRRSYSDSAVSKTTSIGYPGAVKPSIQSEDLMPYTNEPPPLCDRSNKPSTIPEKSLTNDPTPAYDTSDRLSTTSEKYSEGRITAEAPDHVSFHNHVHFHAPTVYSPPINPPLPIFPPYFHPIPPPIIVQQGYPWMARRRKIRRPLFHFNMQIGARRRF